MEWANDNTWIGIKDVVAIHIGDFILNNRRISTLGSSVATSSLKSSAAEFCANPVVAVAGNTGELAGRGLKGLHVVVGVVACAVQARRVVVVVVVACAV